MNTTQEHLPIESIHDDIVILKDGSMAAVIQTSAVNFGLLSENEQLAIISAFAGLLNSLSFMIQVVIRSKRMDITAYLKLLDEAQEQQKNPLLAQMIIRYKYFIETMIRENEVLDKKFYIVVPVSYLELGIVKDNKNNFQKALTILMPRRDHIIRQLARIGLKADQLNTKELVMLFYDIYNEQSSLPPKAESEQSSLPPASGQSSLPPRETSEPSASQDPKAPNEPKEPKGEAQVNKQPIQPQSVNPQPAVIQSQQPQNIPPQSANTYPHVVPANFPPPQQPQTPAGAQPQQLMQQTYQPTSAQPKNSSPFVVEELPD